MIAATTS